MDKTLFDKTTGEVVIREGSVETQGHRDAGFFTIGGGDGFSGGLGDPVASERRNAPGPGRRRLRNAAPQNRRPPKRCIRRNSPLRRQLTGNG